MLFIAVVFGLGQVALAAASKTTVPPLILSGRQSARPPGTYSIGITKLIKLLDAKVDAQVILAYIQNSPIPYDPEAAELIAVQAHGASIELLLALLHHRDDLRLPLAQTQSAVNPALAVPPYDYGPEAAYQEYLYGFPDGSEAPYPATDDSSASGWSWAFWPSISIGGFWPVWSSQCNCPAHHDDNDHVGEHGRRNWSNGQRPAPQSLRSVSDPSRARTDASVARPAPQAPRSVSAPSRGRTGSAVVNSPRSSGRAGGRSGGRSR